MRLLSLRIEYQETAEMLRLRKELEQAQEKLKKAETEVLKSGMRYGREIEINDMLIQKLRDNGINYDPKWEAKWRKDRY